jgi:hypothetical protein
VADSRCENLALQTAAVENMLLLVARATLENRRWLPTRIVARRHD